MTCFEAFQRDLKNYEPKSRCYNRNSTNCFPVTMKPVQKTNFKQNQSLLNVYGEQI